MFLRRTKLSPLRKIKHALARKKGYRRAMHYFAWRLKRLPGTPEFIAKGFAIGVAINFWPILFTHLIFGYIICRIIKGNLISMFIGTLLGNPWTFAIVYPMMYKIGKAVLGLRPRYSEHALDSAHDVFSKIWPPESWHAMVVAFQEIILPMMIGGFLLALPCGLFSYYLVRNIIVAYKAQQRKLLLKKFEAAEHDMHDVKPETSGENA